MLPVPPRYDEDQPPLAAEDHSLHADILAKPVVASDHDAWIAVRLSLGQMMLALVCLIVASSGMLLLALTFGEPYRSPGPLGQLVAFFSAALWVFGICQGVGSWWLARDVPRVSLAKPWWRVVCLALLGTVMLLVLLVLMWVDASGGSGFRRPGGHKDEFVLGGGGRNLQAPSFTKLLAVPLPLMLGVALVAYLKFLGRIAANCSVPRHAMVYRGLVLIVVVTTLLVVFGLVAEFDPNFAYGPPDSVTAVCVADLDSREHGFAVVIESPFRKGQAVLATVACFLQPLLWLVMLVLVARVRTALGSTGAAPHREVHLPDDWAARWEGR